MSQLIKQHSPVKQEQRSSPLSPSVPLSLSLSTQMSWNQSDFANPVVFANDMDTEFLEYLRNFDTDELVEQFTSSSPSHSYNPLGSSLTSELFSDLEENGPSSSSSSGQRDDSALLSSPLSAAFAPSPHYGLASAPSSSHFYSSCCDSTWPMHVSPITVRMTSDGTGNEPPLYTGANISQCNCLPSTVDLTKQSTASTTGSPSPTEETAGALKSPSVVKRRRRRRKQGEPKSFVCTFEGCKNVYFRSSHLKVHVRKHTGEKPFRCTWPDCEWSFRRSDELSRHKRCHSGVKPYACIFCSKCFGRSDHLSKHMKVHQKSQSNHKNLNKEVTL